MTLFKNILPKPGQRIRRKNWIVSESFILAAIEKDFRESEWNLTIIYRGLPHIYTSQSLSDWEVTSDE